MTTVSEIALSLTRTCTTVPPEQYDVCRVCHGSPSPGFAVCYSCAQTMSQVSFPCDRVVPASLYKTRSQLHYFLKYYKDDPRKDFAVKIVALLSYFLARHSGCIASTAGGRWDIITTVPSTKDRAGEHPLATAIGWVTGLRDQHEMLLRRASAAIGHNAANDLAFEPLRTLDGERVLVVDDTFTSGARAQSAASALARGGAQVVAVVPIGRVINPEYNDSTREYWDRQSRIPFDFETCCLEPDTSEEEYDMW